MPGLEHKKRGLVRQNDRFAPKGGLRRKGCATHQRRRDRREKRIPRPHISRRLPLRPRMGGGPGPRRAFSPRRRAPLSPDRRRGAAHPPCRLGSAQTQNVCARLAGGPLVPSLPGPWALGPGSPRPFCARSAPLPVRAAARCRVKRRIGGARVCPARRARPRGLGPPAARLPGLAPGAWRVPCPLGRWRARLAVSAPGAVPARLAPFRPSWLWWAGAGSSRAARFAASGPGAPARGPGGPTGRFSGLAPGLFCPGLFRWGVLRPAGRAVRVAPCVALSGVSPCRWALPCAPPAPPPPLGAPGGVRLAGQGASGPPKWAAFFAAHFGPPGAENRAPPPFFGRVDKPKIVNRSPTRNV